MPRPRSVLPTGLEPIDAAVGGIRSGELTVIAGARGVGKSELLWSVATGIEVPLLYVGERPSGASTPSPAAFHHDDSPRDDLGVMIGRIHETKRALGIRAVFIDGLERFVGARASHHSSLRKSFDSLTAEHGLSVVVSYAVTDVRANRRAHWSDLRGAVVEDPGLLVLVHPESDEPPASKLYLIRCDQPGISTEVLYRRGS